MDRVRRGHVRPGGTDKRPRRKRRRKPGHIKLVRIGQRYQQKFSIQLCGTLNSRSTFREVLWAFSMPESSNLRAVERRSRMPLARLSTGVISVPLPSQPNLSRRPEHRNDCMGSLRHVDTVEVTMFISEQPVRICLMLLLTRPPSCRL